MVKDVRIINKKGLFLKSPFCTFLKKIIVLFFGRFCFLLCLNSDMMRYPL